MTPGTAEVGQFLGVVYEGQLPKQNVGFKEFFWAWNGSGAVVPDGPASAGFLLGNENANSDFDYVGGSPPQFAYLTLSNRVTEAFVTAKAEPFDFLGAIFSSKTPGTLIIVGQEETANGIGGATFRDVPGATTKVTFDALTAVVELQTTDFPRIDRLVFSAVDSSGNAVSLQWALNDFTYAPVPEASTWAMFGLGVLGVGFAVKRRKPRIR